MEIEKTEEPSIRHKGSLPDYLFADEELFAKLANTLQSNLISDCDTVFTGKSERENQECDTMIFIKDEIDVCRVEADWKKNTITIEIPAETGFEYDISRVTVAINTKETIENMGSASPEFDLAIEETLSQAITEVKNQKQFQQSLVNDENNPVKQEGDTFRVHFDYMYPTETREEDVVSIQYSPQDKEYVYANVPCDSIDEIFDLADTYSSQTADNDAQELFKKEQEEIKQKKEYAESLDDTTLAKLIKDNETRKFKIEEKIKSKDDTSKVFNTENSREEEQLDIIKQELRTAREVSNERERKEWLSALNTNKLSENIVEMEKIVASLEKNINKDKKLHEENQISYRRLNTTEKEKSLNETMELLVFAKEIKKERLSRDNSENVHLSEEPRDVPHQNKEEWGVSEKALKDTATLSSGTIGAITGYNSYEDTETFQNEMVKFGEQMIKNSNIEFEVWHDIFNAYTITVSSNMNELISKNTPEAKDLNYILDEETKQRAIEYVDIQKSGYDELLDRACQAKGIEKLAEYYVKVSEDDTKNFVIDVIEATSNETSFEVTMREIQAKEFSNKNKQKIDTNIIEHIDSLEEKDLKNMRKELGSEIRRCDVEMLDETIINSIKEKEGKKIDTESFNAKDERLDKLKAEMRYINEIVDDKFPEKEKSQRKTNKLKV